MSNLTEVTKEEFESYLASYPRKLWSGRSTVVEPMFWSWHDETLKKSADSADRFFESMVAKEIEPYTREDSFNYFVKKPVDGCKPTDRRRVKKEDFDAFLLANQGKLERRAFTTGDPPSISYYLGGEIMAVHYLYEWRGIRDEFYVRQDQLK